MLELRKSLVQNEEDKNIVYVCVLILKASSISHSKHENISSKYEISMNLYLVSLTAPLHIDLRAMLSEFAAQVKSFEYSASFPNSWTPSKHLWGPYIFARNSHTLAGINGVWRIIKDACLCFLCDIYTSSNSSKPMELWNYKYCGLL